MDIVAVTETFLTDGYPNKYIHIPNYNIARLDRPTRGGGLLLYIKSTFSFKIKLAEISESGLEQMWLKIKVNSRNVGVGVIYRPPSVNVSCLDDLSETLQQLYLETQSVVLMGDININLLSKNSTDASKFVSVISNFNLKQVIDMPTRVTETSETLIDVICVSDNLDLDSWDAVDMHNNTDHRFVLCKIKLDLKKSEPKIIKYRSYNNFDLEQFNFDASRIAWGNIKCIEDIDLKIDIFNQAITSLFDVHAPVCTIKTKRNFKPYVTYNIKKMIKIKDNARKKYEKTKTVRDRESYVTLRNYTKEAIAREKKAYMQFIVDKNKNNSKQLWKNLSQWGVCTKSKNELNSLPDELLNPDQLNNYFLNVAGQSHVNIDTLNYYNKNYMGPDIKFNFSEISQNDIYTALRSIKSEATGSDNINLKMINLIIPHCIDVLQNIFNESLKSGIFPGVWKAANILPTPKISVPVTPNDLRPISILPTFSKMFEKIISLDMKKFLNLHNILPVVQSGFREKHSTSTALLKVLNDVSLSLDKSSSLILILLDQSKAFDLVNFDLLLAKLNYLGFDKAAQKWINSYLKNRTQKVVIAYDNESQLGTTSSGVPQGSILGPILFSIYTFDLPSCIKHCKIHLYADDVQLYRACTISQVDESINSINEDLRSFTIWCSNNGLKVNPNKTNALCIGNERQRDIIRLETLWLNNVQINWVESAKNLGLFIDQSLSFNQHINHISKTSYFKLKSLYHLKNQLSEQTKLKLVKSLIYPHIYYCSSVYYHYLTNYNKIKLQRIQNSCMRFVCCTPLRNHITPDLIRLKELNVANRVIYLYYIFLFKVIMYQKPEYLYNLLTKRSNVHNLNVRINSFCVPQHATSKFEGSFAYMAPHLLNEVLNWLDLSIYSFTKNIKNMLLNAIQ